MKPMLSAKTDGTNLRFPLLVSPKLDGIRALIIKGKVYSRKLKLIPNAHVQRLLGHTELNGLDGELIVGSPTSPTAYRDTMSAVMSRDGEPDVTFWVFDDFINYKDTPFHERLKMAQKRVHEIRRCHVTSNIKLVPHTAIGTENGLEGMEEMYLYDGYEGIMLRDPYGLYKEGRSTLKEGWLLKLKRFEDSEAEIMGWEEHQHNANEATVGELGQTKRSSHKANKHGTGKLGALCVRDVVSEVEFNIGTGFTDAERQELWARKDKLYGLIVKYRFFPSGSKDKPRFPTFVGFRDPDDM